MHLYKHQSFFLSLFLVLGGIALTQPALAQNYIYPLDSWNVVTEQGEELSNGTFHMGIDAGFELPAGSEVYAVADGVVKEARERSLFGLVVLVEHTLENGEKNVSLYGHLRPSDVRVAPGDVVKAGDVIGVLGDPDENGGWSVHIHFGIHKAAYSPVWIYYGHVKDPVTGEDWYLPEQYIEDHLESDTWYPTIETDIGDGAIVGNTASFITSARDIGSGVAQVSYKVRQNENDRWKTIYETVSPYGETTVYLPISDYEDGDIDIRVVAEDYFENTTKHTLQLTKDPDRDTTKAFAAMLGKGSNGNLTQWSMGGTLVSAFFPFSQSWSNGGDIAVGSPLDDEELSLVTARGNTTHKGKVTVYSASGVEISSFKPFGRGAIRVDTGDINGDGTDEIIVGSGRKIAAEVKVYSGKGEFLWALRPFKDNPKSGLDVTSADIDNDGIDEVIVGTGAGTKARVAIIAADGSDVIKRFKPFGMNYRGGVNVGSGNVTGNSNVEIIVGSGGKRSGRVRVFSGLGKKKGISLYPFGEEFVGAVDVSTYQWDDDINTVAELLVSQASNGQSWVKLYRLNDELSVLLNKRIYDASFKEGTRIDGWQ